MADDREKLVGAKQAGPVLDYSHQRTVPRANEGYVSAAVGLAVALFLVLGISGVASDHVQIPIPKKVALSAASIIVVTIVIRVVHGRSTGCGLLAVVYGFFIAMYVAVMWFWN